MIRKFIATIAVIFFAATIHTTAFAAEETKFFVFDGVTVEYPKDFDPISLIATKDGVIFAVGMAMGPANWDKQDSFYKTFARQAARMTALRSLAEGIGGVIVETKQVKNKDIVSTRLPHDSKTFKLLKKDARQVSDAEFDKDGVCKFFMAVRVKPRE